MTVNADLKTALLQVLRAVTGMPTLSYATEPELLGGGFWAELLAFSLADPPPGWPRELVARVMPDASTARKETIVQSAVAAAGFPTPAVRASGGPDSGIGRAFMIMDRAPGGPLLPGLDGLGAARAGPRLAREIPEVLAFVMAGLHALDPRPVRDELAQVADVPVTAPGLVRTLNWMAACCGRADLAGAASWLAGHQPPPSPEVVCHGDLHPFNLLADHGRVTVLDWSTALVAPRAHDVAFTALILSEPPLLLPEPLRPVVRRIGRLLARRFIRRYEAHASAVIGADELRWYQAVACLRALTEVAGWEQDGSADQRAGHPWLISGPAIAARLTATTGVLVRPR